MLPLCKLRKVWTEASVGCGALSKVQDGAYRGASGMPAMRMVVAAATGNYSSGAPRGKRLRFSFARFQGFRSLLGG